MDNGASDNMTHSLPPSHSPIPVHPNPFATLADPYPLLPTHSVQCEVSNGPSTIHHTNSEQNVQTTCCPPVKSNPCPTGLPNPVPSPSHIHSHPSQNLQSPSPITSATSPQVIVHLRNVSKHLSVDQVQIRLSSEGIDLNGCSITQPLQDSTFTGSRKFIKITCSSLEKCNSLDKAIKSRSHLPWFLSLYPSYRDELEVPCRYHFVAKRRLIKLKCLPQNQVITSQFFINLIKLAFLKALTITKDFTENTEFNKCRSRLVAPLK